jgi:flagellar basal-body rod modification protein FlgD
MSTVTLPSTIPVYDPQAAAKAASAKATNTLGTSPQELEDNFMRMLVEQMKNQDPLNPADSNQFTSQLAQLNTVKGIETLNAQFTSFASQVGAADFLNSAGLVGQNALVPGSTLVFNGTTVAGGASLAANAYNVRVTIQDAAGKTVDELDLGAAGAGNVKFSWDGTGSDGSKLPAANYQFKIDAITANGAAIAATSLTTSAVTSVQRSSSGTKLALADGRTVSSADVLEWTK